MGEFFYDPKHDELKAPIKVRDNSFTELLTYDFVNITKNNAELVLNWEKKQFPVKIEYDVDKIVMANAAEELKGPVGFNWQGFSTAANYALQNKTDLDQAMKWIDQAIALNNNFNNNNLKANILKAMGKGEEADKLVAAALPNATEAEINAYGYQLLLAGNMDKAIDIFILNTKRFPKSPNTWDSLGEAYFNKGDKKNAATNFRKSLSMNPPAAVKANSEKFLKQLEAM